MTSSIATKCMMAAAVLALMTPGLAIAQDVVNSPYVVTGETGMAHIMPTVEMSRQIKAQQGAQPPAVLLNYHGGPIMTGVNAYAIFWIPAHLQNGGATNLTAKYQSVAKNLLIDYPFHGIANNSTQYYSTSGGVNTFFLGKGGLAGSVVDTQPYPVSGCNDAATPSNCITDAQLRTEIARVMAVQGWTPGFNKIFLVFTSTGEGSCFDSTSSSCAYTQYCAYHSFFGSAGNPTIYANQPYADPTYCFATGVQQSPNGDIPSDANASVTTHEITEANTDPELNAWWVTATGDEIGDLCSFNFGPLTWDGGLANQKWNTHFYDVQMEYNNHTASCVRLGP